MLIHLLIHSHPQQQDHNTAAEEDTDTADDDHPGSSPDVLYVLIVCGILITAISVAHLVFILLHALVFSSPLGPGLRFPRFEVCGGFGSALFLCLALCNVCVLSACTCVTAW